MKEVDLGVNNAVGYDVEDEMHPEVGAVRSPRKFLSENALLFLEKLELSTNICHSAPCRVGSEKLLLKVTASTNSSWLVARGPAEDQ